MLFKAISSVCVTRIQLPLFIDSLLKLLCYKLNIYLSFIDVDFDINTHFIDLLGLQTPVISQGC